MMIPVHISYLANIKKTTNSTQDQIKVLCADEFKNLIFIYSGNFLRFCFGSIKNYIRCTVPYVIVRGKKILFSCSHDTNLIWGWFYISPLIRIRYEILTRIKKKKKNLKNFLQKSPLPKRGIVSPSTKYLVSL
jgi:hypothetical protein